MVILQLTCAGRLKLFTMLYPYIVDAVSLHIESWKNQLRRKSFSDLVESTKLERKIEKFRDCKVLLTKYSERYNNGELNVVVRGYVAPFWLSRTQSFRAFTKYADDSWTENMDDEVYESLRVQIEAIDPTI